MGEKIIKNITLRTLAGDTAAISKNLRPEPTIVAVSVEAATEENELESSTLPKDPHNGGLVKAFGVIFALAALALVGYLLYVSFIQKTPLPV